MKRELKNMKRLPTLAEVEREVLAARWGVAVDDSVLHQHGERADQQAPARAAAPAAPVPVLAPPPGALVIMMDGWMVRPRANASRGRSARARSSTAWPKPRKPRADAGCWSLAGAGRPRPGGVDWGKSRACMWWPAAGCGFGRSWRTASRRP